MNNTAIEGPRLDFKRIGLEDEWCEANGNHQLLPEEELLLALLVDALELVAKNQLGKAETREARRWIKSDNDDSCFTFIAICEHFHFSASAIRKLGLDTALAASQPRFNRR